MPRQQIQLNPFEIQQLRRTMTNKEIAEKYGLPLSTFSTWCHRNNVITARITDYEIEEGLQFMTVKELAFLYNISIHVIYDRLHKNNIYLRKKGGKKDVQTQTGKEED